VDHCSFHDQLTFSIGFAVSRSRDLLRRLLKEHVADDARQQLAERVIDHLELSGFEIDEAEQVMRKAPPDTRPRVVRFADFSGSLSRRRRLTKRALPGAPRSGRYGGHLMVDLGRFAD
jgi:hypothetical protein